MSDDESIFAALRAQVEADTVTLDSGSLKHFLNNQINNKMKNTSEHVFTKIDTELSRVYTFPNGLEVKIDAPQYLSVSTSGGHRILDASEVSHYIPSGWIHLRWYTKEGQPHFVM